MGKTYKELKDKIFIQQHRINSLECTVINTMSDIAELREAIDSEQVISVLVKEAINTRLYYIVEQLEKQSTQRGGEKT